MENWEANEYTDFYRTLNALRHNNPALWAGEKGGELVYVGGVPEEVFAFTREVEGNKVLCLFNLSAEEQQLNLPTEVAGAYTDMYGAPATVETAVVLPAWGYAVYVK